MLSPVPHITRSRMKRGGGTAQQSKRKEHQNVMNGVTIEKSPHDTRRRYQNRTPSRPHRAPPATAKAALTSPRMRVRPSTFLW